jgi:hypothetical protein
MSDESTAEDLRQELKDIDQELAETRRVAGDGQSRRDDGDFANPEDTATDLTGRNEADAIIGTLEERRERVADQLRQLGG